MPDFILPCPFEADVSLAAKAYYGIGGKARFFAMPQSVAELSSLLLWNRTHRLPLALMGSGSNTLFADAAFPGIVISLERMQRLCWLSDDSLLCEAGVENTLIAEELFSAGKSGGEWLYRLPGQIGATVRMNARCFGGEISAVTTRIQTLSVNGELRWRLPDEVFLGYKQTSLMEQPEIVVAVVLRFTESFPAEEIRAKMRQHEVEREVKHHFDFPSCGSTFKNNYAFGRSSGAFFEELGFKGAREGGAVVSEHHANFIYNTGCATAADVLRLAARMRQAALGRAGADLELEVQCVGLFDAELLASCGVSSLSDAQDSSKGWAGLLWSPAEKPHNSFYPRLLMQGQLVGYFGLDREFPEGVQVSVEQLVSIDAAKAAPEAPFFRWTTSRNPALFALKATSPPAFTDGLWRYSVSELFIGNPSAPSYLEFEMTPEGHWVALRFAAPRQRAVGYETLSADLLSGLLRLVQNEKSFGMELSWQLIEPFINDEQVIALQCCASSGRGDYGLFPWWNSPSSPADFHQPDQFFQISLQ
jgi:UDP-N-acetylmuramate dehydrogenase